MAGEIVVGYDGTECADAALDAAISLAKELDSKLVITYGYDPSRLGGEVRDLDQALEERGQEVTKEAAEKAAGEGVDAEVAVVKRKAAPALAELAKQRDARFIVVGTYSERPLTGAILGAVPNKLLHIADRPVLVVPAD
jgi:nucleotide-binding universal stress UspA family protein